MSPSYPTLQNRSKSQFLFKTVIPGYFQSRLNVITLLKQPIVLSQPLMLLSAIKFYENMNLGWLSNGCPLHEFNCHFSLIQCWSNSTFYIIVVDIVKHLCFPRLNKSTQFSEISPQTRPILRLEFNLVNSATTNSATELQTRRQPTKRHQFYSNSC